MPDGMQELPPNEQELLKRARDLEEAALGAIFDAFYVPLYRYIYRRIGIGQTAEDLAAEVFRSFLEELRAGKGPTSYLRAWLYRVAHNLIVDELRRRPRTEHDHLDEEAGSGGPGVGEQVQRSIEREQAQRALRHLTDKQRLVLELRFFQGLETDEIARMLSLSAGTVKALQFRGLQALRKHLLDDGALNEMDS